MSRSSRRSSLSNRSHTDTALHHIYNVSIYHLIHKSLMPPMYLLCNLSVWVLNTLEHPVFCIKEVNTTWDFWEILDFSRRNEYEKCQWDVGSRYSLTNSHLLINLQTHPHKLLMSTSTTPQIKARFGRRAFSRPGWRSLQRLRLGCGMIPSTMIILLSDKRYQRNFEGFEFSGGFSMHATWKIYQKLFIK